MIKQSLNIDNYFSKARSQPPVLSKEEVRNLLEMHSVSRVNILDKIIQQFKGASLMFKLSTAVAVASVAGLITFNSFLFDSNENKSSVIDKMSNKEILIADNNISDKVQPPSQNTDKIVAAYNSDNKKTSNNAKIVETEKAQIKETITSKNIPNEYIIEADEVIIDTDESNTPNSQYCKKSKGQNIAPSGLISNVRYGSQAPATWTCTAPERIDVKGVQLVELSKDELSKLGIKSDSPTELKYWDVWGKQPMLCTLFVNWGLGMKENNNSDMKIIPVPKISPRLITDNSGNRRVEMFTDDNTHIVRSNSTGRKIMYSKLQADSNRVRLYMSMSPDDTCDNDRTEEIVDNWKLKENIEKYNIEMEIFKEKMKKISEELKLKSEELRKKSEEFRNKYKVMKKQYDDKYKDSIDKFQELEDKQMELEDKQMELEDKQMEIEDIRIELEDKQNEIIDNKLELDAINDYNKGINEYEKAQAEFYNQMPNPDNIVVNKMKLENFNRLYVKIPKIKDINNYFVQINKLIPVAVPMDCCENFSFIFWYDPTPEFIEALPERVRMRLEPEIEACRHVGEETICKKAPITGEEPIFDVWRSCNGAIEGLSVFPNPSQGIINVTFTLKEARNVNLLLHDLNGRLIRELSGSEQKQSGTWDSAFELKGIPSGMYLISIQTDKNEKAVQRIIIEE